MKQTFATADLYDAHEKRCLSCDTQFRQYGGRRTFSGRIRTLRALDDNVLLKRTLGEPADGDVLVVDAGGYLGCAMVGDVIAELGRKSGWSGVVIYGAVRDTKVLATLDFGVKALGSNPKKSAKNGTGQLDLPVSFGGITFTPGHWLYSDDDGILVAAEKLL